MEKKITKIEEVPEEKKETFKKAKSFGKTVLKIAGGIALGILALYGFLIVNRDIGRVVSQVVKIK